MEWRLYERATKAGGALLKTTKSGGGVSTTTASGGGSTITSSAGGGTTVTSSAGGNHRHLMFTYDGSTGSKEPISNFGKFYAAGDSGGQSSALVTMPGAVGNLYTKESSGNHNHSITVENHQHSVTIKPHTHSLEIESHSHDLELPPHTHDLEYGIFQYDKMPTKHTIKVDGKVIPITSLSGDNIDIVPYLSKDEDGKVLRGWHTLEITPNDLARVTAVVTTQFFIQSRGEYTL